MAEQEYKRITDDLRKQIETGRLNAGAQLPTKLELMDHYKASRKTVVDAIEWLLACGLIDNRPGQGVFVTARVIPFATTLTGDPEIASGGEGRHYNDQVAAMERKPEAGPPRVEIKQADYQVAELGLEASAAVVSRHQQRFIDGTPWSLRTSFYPMRLVDSGAKRLIQAKDIDEGTVAYLRECLGVEQAGWRDTITVRPADQAEAAFFKLAEDGRVSMIETRRTAFEASGSPVRLTVTAYPADRNQLVVNVGKTPPERS
jgi:GntR family transcriptional regulator